MSKKIPRYLVEFMTNVKILAFVTLFAFLFVIVYSPFQAAQWFQGERYSSATIFFIEGLIILGGVAILSISRFFMWLVTLKNLISMLQYCFWLIGEIIVIGTVYTIIDYTALNDNLREFITIFQRTPIFVPMMLFIPYTVSYLFLALKDRDKKIGGNAGQSAQHQHGSEYIFFFYIPDRYQSDQRGDQDAVEMEAGGIGETFIRLHHADRDDGEEEDVRLCQIQRFPITDEQTECRGLDEIRGIGRHQGGISQVNQGCRPHDQVGDKIQMQVENKKDGLVPRQAHDPVEHGALFRPEPPLQKDRSQFEGAQAQIDGERDEDEMPVKAGRKFVERLHRGYCSLKSVDVWRRRSSKADSHSRYHT